MAIDYLVGIDFGAGETSASYYDVCGEQSPDKTTRLHHLSIVPTGDVSKIYSAIKQVNGEWRLVTDPTDFMCTDLRVDFKRRPSEMDSEKRDSNIKFFRMVFKSILESNKTFLSFNDVTEEKNFLLLVARPTSWSEEDEDEYLALMKEAGLPVDLVVKESEAALAKWSQKALQGNTLVVDCGSSTIDLTLVQNGKLYDGPLYSCIPPKGAKRVEGLLKEYLEQDEQYVSDCRDVQRKLLERNINLNLDEAIKLFLRNNKERFYTNTPEAIELSLKKRPFIGEKGDVIDVVLTRNELEKIVSPYFDELRKFFENVKGVLCNSGIVVEKLILSGGASRMPLVKQILSEVFAINGNDDEVFFHDKASADYVVSDGLAILYKDALSIKGDVTVGYIGYQDKNRVSLRLDATRQIGCIPSVKLCFTDIHKNFVFEKRVNNIVFDKDCIARTEFEVEEAYHNRFYKVDIVTDFESLGYVELYPKTIYIRVENLCFRMDYCDSFYKAYCCFPLWWLLMPNTTHRDIRYAGYDIELREIVSPTFSLNGRVAKASDFIQKLRLNTDLKFSFVTRSDYDDRYWQRLIYAGVPECCAYFDENSEESQVHFKLKGDEYKSALLNDNSHLFSPTADIGNWRLINSDGECFSYEKSLSEMKTLIDSRYNGLY